MALVKLSEGIVKAASYMQRRVLEDRNLGFGYRDFRMAALGDGRIAIGTNVFWEGASITQTRIDGRTGLLANQIRNNSQSVFVPSLWQDRPRFEFYKMQTRENLRDFFGVPCNTILVGKDAEPGFDNVSGLLPGALGPVSLLLSIGLEESIVGSHLYREYEGKPLAGDIEYFDLFADVAKNKLYAGIKGVNSDASWITAANQELLSTIRMITGEAVYLKELISESIRPYDMRFDIG